MVSIENIDGYMKFVYEGWMTKLNLDKVDMQMIFLHFEYFISFGK